MDAREGKDGRREKRGSVVCFSSLHFALGAVAGGYMYKGARVPVARSLAISSTVSRSQSCSGLTYESIFRSCFLIVAELADSSLTHCGARSLAWGTTVVTEAFHGKIVVTNGKSKGRSYCFPRKHRMKTQKIGGAIKALERNYTQLRSVFGEGFFGSGFSATYTRPSCGEK